MKFQSTLVQSFAMVTIMTKSCSSFHIRRVISRSLWSRAKPVAAVSSPSLQGMYDSLTSIPNVQISTADPWACTHIAKCVEHMAKVVPEDLSLSGYSVQKTACMHISDTPNFQIAAFTLPKGRTLPVHDHPGMTVISKVVVGELGVTSFSAEDQSIHTATTTITPSSINVYLQEYTLKRPSDQPWIISPRIGNYHEFTARSDCIILDVLLPPYAYPERPCTYYNATPVPPLTTLNAIATAIEQLHSSNELTRITGEALKGSKWKLSPMSEVAAHRKFGLPSSAAYPGYVPK